VEFYHRVEAIPDIAASVLTVGTFDGLHYGHAQLINRVVEQANILQVASVLITFNPHPKEVLLREKKVPVELLTTIEEKREILSQEFNLSHVLVLPFTKEFSQVSASDFLQQYLINPFHPKEIVIGYDHRFGQGREGDAEFLRERENQYQYQTEVVEAVRYDDEQVVSSSFIRELLREGKTLEAQKYLTRPYQITGVVEHGAKRGRDLNFPTANLKPENEHKLLPADGIYLVYVTGENTESYGLCSIGNRPTFDDNQHTIEVYLLNTPDQSLYTQSLTIHFFNRLRQQEKFDSADALVAQMEQDEALGLKLIEQQNPWETYQQEQMNAFN